MFTNLNNGEKFIDKYFNYQRKIEPNVVEVLDNEYRRISKDDKYFSFNFNFQNNNKEQHKIFNLIKDEITYRDLNNSKNLINIFLCNFIFIHQTWRFNGFSLHSGAFIWNYYWDNVVIYMILFFIFKKINKFESVPELEKTIKEYSIHRYFEFNRYKKNINDWIEKIENREYSYTKEYLEIKKVQNEQLDFIYLLSIQTQITIMYYFPTFETNININLGDWKLFFENLRMNLLKNINKLFDLFKKDITNSKEK